MTSLTDDLAALLPDHGDDPPPPRRPVTDRQRAHAYRRMREGRKPRVVREKDAGR
jgi:hypothetical protein